MLNINSLICFFLLLVTGFLGAQESAEWAPAEELEFVVNRPGPDSRIRLAEEYPQLTKIGVKVKNRQVHFALPGEFPLLREVAFDSSWGNVWGTFDGHFSELSKIEANTSSGRVVLDLRGEWDHSCDVYVDTSSGMISIKVPKDVGVSVDASTVAGKIFKGNLNRKHWWKKDLWVSDNYETAEICLNLHLRSRSGNISVKSER